MHSRVLWHALKKCSTLTFLQFDKQNLSQSSYSFLLTLSNKRKKIILRSNWHACFFQISPKLTDCANDFFHPLIFPGNCIGLFLLCDCDICLKFKRLHTTSDGFDSSFLAPLTLGFMLMLPKVPRCLSEVEEVAGGGGGGGTGVSGGLSLPVPPIGG